MELAYESMGLWISNGLIDRWTDGLTYQRTGNAGFTGDCYEYSSQERTVSF
jgi:hypothetical protein